MSNNMSDVLFFLYVTCSRYVSTYFLRMRKLTTLFYQQPIILQYDVISFKQLLKGVISEYGNQDKKYGK